MPVHPDDSPQAVPPSRQSALRRNHLERSAQAVAPLYVDDVLSDRPARRSQLSDPAERQRYHRHRQASRGDEALTPGADLDIAALPTIRRRGDRWEFTPGSFVTTSSELFYSSSFSLIETHVWTYLLNHRCPRTFHRTGEIHVEGVRLADIASTASVSASTVSRALARLEAKRRLVRRRRGLGRTNAYILTAYESGASCYPVGHPRSARRRLQRTVRLALDDPRSPEALLLQSALGVPLAGHDAASLLSLVWRTLDRATEAHGDHALVASPTPSTPPCTDVVLVVTDDAPTR